MKRGKVLLVYPRPDRLKHYRFGYSLLLLYIGAGLREKGYDPVLLDYSVEHWSREKFVHALESASAVVLEVDAFPLKRSVNVSHAEMICTVARESKIHVPLIAVGKQCTLNQTAFVFADVTVGGDSELAIAAILDAVVGGQSIPRYVDVGRISDLGLLPLPAYDLLSAAQICGQTTEHPAHLAPSALFETSRGCPGHCTFCQRKGWEERVLGFPVSHVVANYEQLVASGIRNCWITDENFATGPYASEVLTALAEHRVGQDVRISMSSWVHVGPRFLESAKNAGVSIISFGIESVDPVAQRFYNKPINPVTTLQMLAYAHELGIYTVGNFILGAPGDTAESIRRTIDFAIESTLDKINVKTLDYMVGSEIYNRLPEEKKKGIHFFSCAENGTTRLAAAEIDSLRREFEGKFAAARRGWLEKKMNQFGPPYHEENQDGRRSAL